MRVECLGLLPSARLSVSDPPDGSHQKIITGLNHWPGLGDIFRPTTPRRLQDRVALKVAASLARRRPGAASILAVGALSSLRGQASLPTVYIHYFSDRRQEPAERSHVTEPQFLQAADLLAKCRPMLQPMAMPRASLPSYNSLRFPGAAAWSPARPLACRHGRSLSVAGPTQWARPRAPRGLHRRWRGRSCRLRQAP